MKSKKIKDLSKRELKSINGGGWMAEFLGFFVSNNYHYGKHNSHAPWDMMGSK
ncbi:hypothetical protein [Marinifilum sp. D737]|uniref:hypothetical protein n=1 Tax=Marinifilum sp. D737 TaxID=2969628 RepID=UPI002276B5F9|nr:hypothetical protein [Marinifilum sp. D737]MCY1636054.1 hypothetical protein [Marinifilum sp. D737]